MPDQSSHKSSDIKRVRQITSAHCGPAVIEMLLSHFGVEVSQDDVTKAVGAEKRIKDYGMSVLELIMAVKKLAPDMVFWYKNDSSITELMEIVRRYNYPVGINWQGIFEDDDYGDGGFEYDGEDDDEGHYSVVTDIDTLHNFIRISDPYGHYSESDRLFSIVEFEKRWWDEGYEYNPLTKKQEYFKTNRLMFLILPASITFPQNLGMTKG